METHYADRDLSAQLRGVIERELCLLRSLTAEQVSVHPNGPASWSPKQELGHLIDSATNNHIRFVRGAFETTYEGPSYAQNEWVAIHGYQAMEWEFLVTFWSQYNLLLAKVIERILRDSFETNCTIGGSAPVPLGFVIEDYILHMQHHLDHILGREVVTQYPAL